MLILRCWYSATETLLLILRCWNSAADTPLLKLHCWNSIADTPQLTVQKSPLLPCSHALLLSIYSWKNWMIFSSFSSLNLTPSDFWVIQVTFGWFLNPMVEIDWDLRLRLNAHVNLTFYFFNSPHFNKDPLSHLFLKSFFLSNFSLTL